MINECLASSRIVISWKVVNPRLISKSDFQRETFRQQHEMSKQIIEAYKAEEYERIRGYMSALANSLDDLVKKCDCTTPTNMIISTRED